MQTDKQLQEQLIQLGLTKHEAAVYMALLDLGLTQAGPLVKKTKMHRMIVYTALSNLVDKGLVSIVRKKRVQLFSPLDPGVFVKRSEETLRLAQHIVPELQQRLQMHPSVVDVRTLTGVDALRINSIEIVDAVCQQKDKTMRIIGGGKTADVYSAFESWYPQYIQLLKEKGVKKRLLAPAEEYRGFEGKYRSEGSNSRLRLVQNGLTSPSYTRITEKMVSIEMYTPEIVVIQIRSSVIAQGYLESFDLLWESIGKDA